MLSRSTVLFAGLAAGVLAGCSGGGGTSMTPGSGGPNHLTPQVISATPTPSPAPTPTSGTLYYAGTSTVYAIPLTASGATTASRSITPHPNQSRVVTALATNADGTLDVLQNYIDSNSVQHCAVTVESANANGSPAAVQNVPCDATATTQTQGDGVARNTIGGFDLFYNTTSANYIKRFSSDGATLSSSLQPPFGLYLATDRGGHDYINNSGGEILKYKASATTATAVADCNVPVGTHSDAYYGAGQIAIAPDLTIYEVVNTTSTTTSSQQIDAITGCGTGGAAATVSRVIGPFPNFFVSAIAVDNEGELYVAMNSPTNSAPALIRVYASNANDSGATKPVPVRIINPSPTTTYVRGLAISE